MVSNEQIAGMIEAQSEAQKEHAIFMRQFREDTLKQLQDGKDEFKKLNTKLDGDGSKFNKGIAGEVVIHGETIELHEKDIQELKSIVKKEPEKRDGFWGFIDRADKIITIGKITAGGGILATVFHYWLTKK